MRSSLLRRNHSIVYKISRNRNLNTLMKVGKRVKLPSLSLITNHNRNIARAVMLVATLFFGWRMAGLLWLLAGQDRADLAKPTLLPEQCCDYDW